MQNCEHDLTGMLMPWAIDEKRIVHLYELDPTHAVARPSAARSIAARHSSHAIFGTSSLSLLGEQEHPAVLLELDPTHLHAG